MKTRIKMVYKHNEKEVVEIDGELSTGNLSKELNLKKNDTAVFVFGDKEFYVKIV